MEKSKLLLKIASLVKLVTVTVILLVIAASIPIHGQDKNKISARDSIINEIKSYAERHVNNDSPMQAQLLVDLYKKFELHRMNDSKRSLQEHLIETLARNDFPNAENFLSQSLKQGTLMLLFDGLDEVNRIERNRVVREIKDLLEKYRQCRVLITCRTAVYKGEFDDGVDRIMEISDFSDQQIRRFLSSWEPDMPPDKSIKQLMNTLHDRPKIMALARNPLLLTIIAYLYTDTPYVLPHSRAEFYRQSTDVLLRQWHQERNKYEARNKRLILQHLALYNQDGTDKHFQDRRSMDYKEVIQQVRIVLPQLNLNPEQDTIPIINEIIERSGLLLSIDNGERFQFAHLTLQEFFAASELVDNPGGLFERFSGDQDAWRETVKLWCGLAGDSTNLIQKIYKKDTITAFECLADAQKVEQSLCEEIIDSFKSHLKSPGEDELVLRAFGSVASDLRPRGKAVFNFLEEALIKENDASIKISAAKALSFTNLPKAAKLLAENSDRQPEVRRGSQEDINQF
jgi:hypothetical protein